MDSRRIKNKPGANKTLSRRDFIKKTGLIAGGLAIGGLPLLEGCASSSQTIPVTQPTTQLPPTSTQTNPLSFPAGAYQNSNILADAYNLSWSNDTQFVYIGIKAITPNWVALAFSGSPHGNTAGTVIGFVQNGQVTLNEYGYIDYNGAHELETAIGGTNNVTLVSGSLINGVTTIEFKRLLNTGDPHDVILTKGNNQIAWAIGDTSDLAQEHAQAGTGSIVIQ